MLDKAEKDNGEQQGLSLSSTTTTTTHKPLKHVGVLYKHTTILAMSEIIGVGKTTLADKLGTLLGCTVYHELGPDVDKIEAFYADMAKNAFSLQVHLLTKRLEQHQSMVYSGINSIVDRSIYEDAVFAHVLNTMGFITKTEYDIYLELSRVVHNGIRHPTAIIHLDTTPEIALKRIQARGRKCEQGITLEYLKSLHAAYEVFILELAKEVPIIRFSWNEFEQVETVAMAIVKELETLHTLHNVKL